MSASISANCELALEVSEAAKWLEWDTIAFSVYDTGINGSEHAQRMAKLDRCNEIEQLIGDEAATKAWDAGQRQFRAEVAEAIRLVVKDDVIAAWLASDYTLDVVPALKWIMLPVRELAPDLPGGLNTTTFDLEKLKAESREVLKQISWRTLNLSVYPAEVMRSDDHVWSEKSARSDLICKVIGADASTQVMKCAQRQFRAEVEAKVKGAVAEDILAKWLAGDESDLVMEAIVKGLREVMPSEEEVGPLGNKLENGLKPRFC